MFSVGTIFPWQDKKSLCIFEEAELRFILFLVHDFLLPAVKKLQCGFVVLNPPQCLANGLSWTKLGTKHPAYIIVFNYSTLVCTMVSSELSLEKIFSSHTALICPGSCRIIVISTTSITNISQKGPGAIQVFIVNHWLTGPSDWRVLQSQSQQSFRTGRVNSFI